MATTRSRRLRGRLLGGAVVVLLVVIAAGCGGGGATTTTSAGSSATVQWADGVCSSFAAWQQSLRDIRKSFKGSQLSSSELRRAGREVENATQTLTRSLKRLGKPDTAAGEAAKKSLDTLATQLSNSLDKIDQALKSNPSSTAESVAVLSTVTGAVTAMASDLSSAGKQLKQSEPGSELEQAFKQAKSCAALSG
jgi:hypothetical protein